MHALIHHVFGDPATELRYEEIAEPTPGPGQLVVAMTAAPIHNHDLLTVDGRYGFTPRLPARAGSEAMGVVEAVGEGVTDIAVGDRVAGPSFGVWADKYLARADSVVQVPDEMPDAVAAQIFSMPLSAATLLHSLHVEEGDWIVQNAANGAVGHLLARFARDKGVNVLGLVRSAAGVAALAEDGIENVVATDAPDWRERVAEATGGAPIVVGVDSVGGTGTGDILSLVADGGRLVLFGGMASWDMQAALGDVIFRDVKIEGFWGSRAIPALPAAERAELVGDVIARTMSGEIELPVEATFGLAEIADAVAAHHRPGRRGKIMLRP